MSQEKEHSQLADHFQAGTLIHELSHLVLDTKDIAYLEANAPPVELLAEDTAANVRIRADIERRHAHRLSHRTRKDELFKVQDFGRWRDLNRGDARGFATILRISGARTLEQAREVFLSDVHTRSRIMLSNADSVTLLIARLGRRNWVMPTP